MNPQHLSDEAVAACADGVLSGHARTRATKHIAECAECAQAVKVQREAAWALRLAPSPALPSGLLDRLRTVPDTTVVTTLPTSIGPDGSAVLTGLAPMAAFVPSAAESGVHAAHRLRPFVATAAVVALTGALTAGSVAHHAAAPLPPGTGQVAHDPGAGSGNGPVNPVHQVSVVRPAGR